jgi:flagellar protein FlaJ
MSSIKLSLKRKGTASFNPKDLTVTRSNVDEGEKKKPKKPIAVSQRNLQFDLFAHLSYMASIATAGVNRAELFEYASELPYSSSRYFRDIHMLARKLNIDYAEACTMVSERTKNGEMRSLLLRFAGSLASGEDEITFLKRESLVIGEAYTNQYERDIASLSKWTDAYVTLLVASGLIVIIAVISMMIYSIGVPIIIGMAALMVFSTTLGAWIIYVSAPREVKTRITGNSSRLQKLSYATFRFTGPMAVLSSSVVLLMGLELGFALLVASAFLFPTGYLISKDDSNISKKDADISSMVRVLGGVTSAIGTTITEALGIVDKRSMGNLKTEVTRLRNSLLAGIDPDLCWRRLVDETGSELVSRTVEMFHKSISMGGDPAKVGESSAFYSSRIAYLRAKRTMVASTFNWLVLPMHIAMVGLLEFIVQIMILFSQQVAESQAKLADSTTLNNQYAVSELFTFGQIDLGMVSVLVTSVVMVLTIVNSIAPKAAAGGSNLKLAYHGSLMLAITGCIMLGVPRFANSIFSSIVDG